MGVTLYAWTGYILYAAAQASWNSFAGDVSYSCYCEVVLNRFWEVFFVDTDRQTDGRRTRRFFGWFSG